MVTLETERLLIRPIERQDLDAMYRILDVELAEANVGTEGAASKEERARWVEWTVLGHQQQEYLHQPPYGERAVVLKATNEVVGAVGYVPLLCPFAQLPSFGAEPYPALYSPEFGLYWAILPKYQRKGLATEAARGMVDYALGTMRVRRIVATTSYDNAASIRVMEKLGMRIERNPHDDPPWFQVVGILEASRAG